MKDFFTFYENMKELKNAFLSFSLYHVLYLGLVVAIIVFLYRFYNHQNDEKKHKFLTYMACYFLIEEAIYTIWLVLNCTHDIWIQILPLELCSLCAYMNALAVFTHKESLRFFGGVVGLIAGCVAMLYPANISGLYPAFSYRVINFYCLHGSFVLFALIQLKDQKLLSYVHLKKNTILICSMFTIAFFVNIGLKTQFMFIGAPPKISFIYALYKVTGIVLFLPVVLIVLVLLQFIVLFILRKLYRVST
ncbi:TMEM164 family acyltransferase [Amedibacillus sp. YH-ame10]